MNTKDPAVETARISARQAIVVALITGIVSILTTLIATGNLLTRESKGSASSSGSGSAAAPVMEAPHIYFSWRNVSFSPGECVEKARGALDRGKFTGINTKEYFSQGYREKNIGAIWCQSDVKQVVFITAGKVDTVVRDTRTILHRSY